MYNRAVGRISLWPAVLALVLLVGACTKAEPIPVPPLAPAVVATPTATTVPVPAIATPTLTTVPAHTPEKTLASPTQSQPAQYVLRLQVGPSEEGGIIKVEPQPQLGGSYQSGTLVKLFATGNEGFDFGFWKIEGPAGVSTSKENPLTFSITSNMSIAAHFEKAGAGEKERGKPQPTTGGMMAVCPPAVGTSSPVPPLDSITPSAPGSVSLKVVGQLGGPTRAVAVQGHFAYVGVGFKLVVLDVSDPKTPRELGATEPLGWYVQDVAVEGSLAYVAAGGGGFYVVDLSDPTRLVVAASYDTPGYAESVAVAGRYAYVADGPGGLRIVDIADPAKPTQVAVVYSQNYVFDVALVERHAYLAAAGTGLLVVDVSNPAQPVELGRYDTPGYAYSVSVSGTTAYVADGWEGLQIVDISNPQQPKQAGSYDTPGWAMDVVAAGARLYIADAFAGLRVLDVSDKAKPTELGSFQVPSGHAAKLAVSGGAAYVADIYQGVHVVNISTPAQPGRVGLYSPLGYAQAVEVSNRYAYVAGQAYGLRVVDLSDPTRPREVATFSTENTAGTVAHSDSTVYIGTGVPIDILTSNYPPALYAVDISDPLLPKAPAPQPLTGHLGNATFQGPGPIVAGDIIYGVSRSTFIQGTTLYNASEWGLLVIDVSNSLAPCELGFLLVTPAPIGNNPSAVGVAVSGSVAYLAVAAGGLYTIDVSNPRSPTPLGVFDEPTLIGPGGKKNPKGINFVDVVVAGKLAYALDNDFLRVLDVTDPKSPKGLGSIQLPAFPSNDPCTAI